MSILEDIPLSSANRPIAIKVNKDKNKPVPYLRASSSKSKAYIISVRVAKISLRRCLPKGKSV